MKYLLIIFLGGGAGSVLRFLISKSTQSLWNLGGFPLGTFTVNMLGCLLIGIFSSTIIKEHNELRLLLIAGFCGGFTTFSAFSLENLALWQNQNYLMLTLYTTASILLGMVAVWLGSHFQL
ncbi:fluoride efflux transporter CrcB [Chryseobacterium sp.]|nr:fluoride efflux transporter CrcB [Chryseobacterium sp.]